MSSVILIGNSSVFYYHVFQDSSQDLNLFHTTSSSVPAFSTSSLFPDALSVTVSPPKSSTVQLFSTLPVSAESVSTTSVTFPQTFSSMLSTTTFPATSPQSFSMASPAPSAPPVTPQQVCTLAGAPHSPLTPLSHNLQDLALLDLGSPKKWVILVPWGKTGEGMWVKCQTVHLSHTISRKLVCIFKLSQ